jgi:hypothetical protein
MEEIQAFRAEIKRNGSVYRVLLTMPFFYGDRLCWRVVYVNSQDEQIVREYQTGRVKRGDQLVIE